jgi:uncharacterized iron-regulated protein
MKKIPCILLLLAVFAFNGCKKDDDDNTPVSDPVTSQQVLNDFAYVVAIPNYDELRIKTSALNDAVIALHGSLNDANLDAAQIAWRAVRIPWENSEAFLFGPAEDYSYDPATDTWPVNTVELDSLLASNNPLLLPNIDSLQYSLKGYHAIEYVLFGVGGTRTAATLSAREMQYLVSLSQSLLITNTALSDSWNPSTTDNFTFELLNAGSVNSRYASRKDALLAIVGGISGICNEVANNKMEAPLVALDSQQVESQYAHNATTDFLNNIIGVQNVYFGHYGSTTGKSLHDLVSAKDAPLDGLIQSQITTAINALNAIDPNYGEAIFTQQSEILYAQNSINDLFGTFNLLNNFILANVTD